MTDKQLEEYTRLKIQEATKELQDKYDKLNSASKEYKSTYGSSWGANTTYYSKDDLTKELKEKTEKLDKVLKEGIENMERIIRLENKYCKATEEHIKDIEKINNFKNSSLLTRIGLAIRGELWINTK